MTTAALSLGDNQIGGFDFELYKKMLKKKFTVVNPPVLIIGKNKVILGDELQYFFESLLKEFP